MNWVVDNGRGAVSINLPEEGNGFSYTAETCISLVWQDETTFTAANVTIISTTCCLCHALFCVLNLAESSRETEPATIADMRVANY